MIGRCIKMEKVKDDFKDFFTNDTTQKFGVVSAILIILRVFGIIDGCFFQEVMKWNVILFWGANGLDLLTNIKKI